MTGLFIAIVNMSITASVVALAVMLARIPLGKAPKIFSYTLWGVVLFRLVFPFSIESVFSLMPTNAIPQDIILSHNPSTGIQLFDAPLNTTVSGTLQAVIPGNGTNPIHMTLVVAGYVWLVGFIALLLFAVIGYVSLKRRVYYATLVRDNIYETDKIKTPFVLGFIRPKIYFPATIDLSRHDYILKHEQVHIKRCDYLIKPLAYIAFALHWFNPIMWISYFLMSKDMEMSCDEAVLSKINDDIRSDYSTSLLSLSTVKVGFLSPIAFAFGKSNVKERVVNVLSFKKSGKWVVVVSTVAVMAFFAGFASNRTTLAAIEVPGEQHTANPQVSATPSPQDCETRIIVPPGRIEEQLSVRMVPLSDFEQLGFDIEWFPNLSMGTAFLRKDYVEIVAINRGHGIAVNYRNNSITFSATTAPRVVDGVMMLPYGMVEEIFDTLSSMEFCDAATPPTPPIVNPQVASDGFVPLSDFEQLGFDVEWFPDMSMGMAVLRMGNLEIIAINRGHGIAVNYRSNSMVFSAIKAPQIVDGVMMLPNGLIDEILEALDMQLN